MTEFNSLATGDQGNPDGIPGIMGDHPDSTTKLSPALAKQTLKGINWQFLATAVQIILSLVVGIVLARLLSPEDFGIVGYVLVFVGLTKTIAESGVSSALIQLSDLTDGHLGVGLVLSFAIALLAIGLLWFLSPILVHGISVPILRITSLIFLINAPSIISESLLRRSLNFFPLFIVDAISYSIGYGLVSILLALTNHGVWSLVIGIMVQSVIRSGLLYFISPYRLSIKFSKTELNAIVRFGTGITLTKISNYGANNLDYYVTGTYLDNQALGFYQRSFQLITQSLLSIAGILTSVLFPVFSKIQNDLASSRRMYLLSVKITSIVVFPIAILVSLVSRELIIVLYGSQWTGSITALSILSFNALLISILTLGDALARGSGLVFHQARRHFLYALMVFTFAFIGKRFYIEGIAIGVTLATFVMYLIMAKLSINTVKAKWRDFFIAQVPACFIGSVMGIITYALGQIVNVYIESEFMLLIIKTILAGIVIIITLLVIPKKWLGEIPQYITKFIYDKYPKLETFVRKIYRHNGDKASV